MKGLFVAFEGANGVGKSTVINKIYQMLKIENIDVYLTKEPSASLLGNFTREIADSLKGKTLACLSAADRYYHVEKEIIPRIELGTIILCDRNILSAYVFNKMDGISFQFTDNLYNGITYPDATILFTASINTIQSRLMQREYLTRYELSPTGSEQKAIYDSLNYLKNKKMKIFEVSTECEISETIDRTYNIIKELIKNNNL